MSRSLPLRPSLRYLQEEAKDLLKSHRRGESRACAPLRLIPRFAHAGDSEILSARLTLADVQFALALHYGFKSWAEMKRAVEAQSESAVPLSDPATFSGQVLDKKTGAPLANARICLGSSPEDAGVSVRSDVNDRFRLAADGMNGPVTVLAEGYAVEIVMLGLSRGQTLERTFKLGREAVVTGQVRDEDGKPLADVEVRTFLTVETVGLMAGPSDTTDRKGRYAVHHVPRGHTLYLEAPGQGYLTAYTVMDIPPDVQSLTCDFVMKRGSTIAGRVIDEAGRPIEGVAVRHSSDSRREALSDAQGRFDLAGLPYNFQYSHILTAVKDGYAMTFQQVGRGFGDGTSSVVITMKPEMTIRGVVVDESGAPVPRPLLWIDHPYQVPAQTTIGARDGTFVLDKLGEGLHNIVLNSSGGYRRFAAVSAGTTDVRLVVRNGASFTGRVIDAETAAPIQVFKVFGAFTRTRASSSRTSMAAHWGHDFRNEHGSFELGSEVDPDQVQRFIILAPEYCVREVDNVRPGQLAEIRLWKAQPVVVHVVDRDTGKAIDGATATFHYWRGSFPLRWARMNNHDFLPPLEGRSLGDGRYEFLGVGNGPWLLNVEAGGYMLRILKFPDGPELATIEVACLRKGGANIRGIVVDEIGNPIEGAAVLGEAWSDVRATTDKEGRFSLDTLVLPTENDWCGLCVSKEGLATVSRNLDSKERSESTPLRITLKPERTISGILVNEKGKPVPNAKVGVSGAFNESRSTVTDAKGAFLLRNLEEGSYNLWISHDDIPSERSPAIKAGTTNVRLLLRKGVPLAGTVKDADTGSPVKSFDIYQVEFNSSSSAPLICNSGRAFEDPAGNFTWGQGFRRDCEFRLVARAPGYCAMELEHVKPGRPIEIRLRKAVPLAVRVAEAVSGRPISGAQVRFYYWIGRGEIDPRRDPAMDDLFLTPLEASDLGEGRYEALGVGSGQWMLRVRAPGFAPHTRILAGDPGAEEIRVSLARRHWRNYGANASFCT